MMLTLVIILLLRGFPKISTKQVWQVLSVGFVGYGISLSLQFLGTKLSTAANGSLVTSATPAFVLIFAWILLKERITFLRLIALVLATLGVVAVIDPRSGVIGGVLFLGIISTALAMVLWNSAFAFVDASLAALTFFAQPVVGTFLGWLFLGERITPLFLFGGFLIGLGLLISSRE